MVFFKLTVLLNAIISSVSPVQGQSIIKEPELSHYQRYDISKESLLDRDLYDVNGDTIAYLSLSHYQRYLYDSDYSLYLIDVKSGEFQKYELSIPEEFRDFVLNEKLILRDIAFRDNTLFLLFLTCVLEASYDESSKKFSKTDWYKLPGEHYFNIYAFGNSEIICSRISHHLTDPKFPDAEILVFDRTEKQAQYHKEFQKIAGSQLCAVASSQWIIHRDKYTVLACPGHYKLKLINNKNMQITHQVFVDSLVKPLHLQDSSFYQKHDSQKEYIRKKTTKIDSIDMIAKVAFLNDTMVIVVRNSRKFGWNQKIFIDFWEIKDDKLLLRESGISVYPNRRSDYLREKTITVCNFPLPIVYSPPIMTHNSQIIFVGVYSKDTNNLTDLIGRASYQDYLTDFNQDVLSGDLFLELRFYNLLEVQGL